MILFAFVLMNKHRNFKLSLLQLMWNCFSVAEQDTLAKNEIADVPIGLQNEDCMEMFSHFHAIYDIH